MRDDDDESNLFYTAVQVNEYNKMSMVNYFTTCSTCTMSQTWKQISCLLVMAFTTTCGFAAVSYPSHLSRHWLRLLHTGSAFLIFVLM